MTQSMLISVLTAESIPTAVEQAVQVLGSGGLVAFPTDTVYGLAAHAFDPQGINLLYRVKERETNKAIAILLASLADLGLVTINLQPHAYLLADHFWPGPLTLVVPRHPDLPENISTSPTIGVRMPNHPLALALLRASGPLAVTSANLSGYPNATNAGQVQQQLGGRVDLIIDGGETAGGTPSTVVDCMRRELVVLRQGPISKAELDRVLSSSK